jgi:hypothetical protein
MTKLTLYDNSRLRDHRKCNRYFYWRHRRHLTRSGPNPAADFGSCWSAAQDVIWPGVKRGLDNATLVEVGLQAFINEWTGKYNHPLLEDMNDDQVYEFKFRHEQTAAAMLQNYVERRRKFIEDIEILGIERPFAVPLYSDDPTKFAIGKIDKEIRWNGGVWGLDHKSTSLYRKDGGFDSSWLDDWHMRSQMDQYMHSLKMRYGREAKGILIDAALVHAKVNDAFQFIPIDKATSHLTSWLWEVHHEIAVIESNDRNLAEHRRQHDAGTVDYDFMPAFPKNDNSCIAFMKPCPYVDLCRSTADPEDEPDYVPEGYVVKKWEPFDELKLQQIGLEPGEDDAA